MKIIGLYFSGTGNTKWVATRLMDKLENNNHQCEFYSIEDIKIEETISKLKEANLLFVLYPAYGNNMPEILIDYLEAISNSGVTFPHLQSISIDVPGLYSADGVLASEFFYEACKIQQIGGYNVYLSCNFNTLVPFFQIDSHRRNENKKRKAIEKLDQIISNLENKITVFDGCGSINKWIGRLEKGPNEKMMKPYQVKVNSDLCITCGKCVSCCPTQNFKLEENTVATKGHCTICLRCMNQCPTYAIRMIDEKGTKSYVQYKGPESLQ